MCICECVLACVWVRLCVWVFVCVCVCVSVCLHECVSVFARVCECVFCVRIGHITLVGHTWESLYYKLLMTRTGPLKRLIEMPPKTIHVCKTVQVWKTLLGRQSPCMQVKDCNGIHKFYYVQGYGYHSSFPSFDGENELSFNFMQVTAWANEKTQQ